MIAQFLQDQVDIIEIGPNAYLPSEWKEEFDGCAAAPFLKQLILAVSEATLQPWIVSSLSKSLEGVERTDSPSHMAGVAGDIAPMYSQDIILPEDPPLSSLSTNILLLTLIAPAVTSVDVACAIEADHIHALASTRLESMNPAYLLTIPNPSAAYSISKMLDCKLPPALFDFAQQVYAPYHEDLDAMSALRDLAQLQDDLVSSAAS